MNIKPIESYKIVGIRTEVCDEPEVRKLEANYKEAIDVLITLLYRIDNVLVNKGMLRIHYKREIGIIERATNQKWEDLINDKL